MAKPPDPRGVPKQWGRKPKAPKAHKNSGRFDNGSNTLNSKGCAVTALAFVGGVIAISYEIWRIVS